MTSRTQTAARPWIGAFTVAGLFLAGGPMLSADEPTRDEQFQENVRVALHRQKSKELRVYLRDARRVYVNGRQIPMESLAEIAKQAELSEAVISAEPVVTKERIAEVTAWLRKGGIEEVSVTAPRPRPVEGREAKIKLILHRQKGDRLKVYANNRGLYVNGTSVSFDTLVELAERSKLEKATITAEPYVTDEYVAHVEGLLTKADVDEIDRAVAKQR